MKQKFKQILKVSFIFTFFHFTSCVNDDFVEDNPQKTEKNSDYKVKRLSNNDLKNNSILKNRIEKFSRKKDNLQQRNIYYSDYGFSIDTDDFLFIGNDNVHTYTFNVEKDVEDEYVENLVLKHTGNNNYIAFLIRYDLTEQDKEAIEAGQSISNYLSKAEFAYIPEINGSILGTQNRTITYTSIECNDVVVGKEYTETYDENGVGHWELITYYQVVCEEVTHVVQIIDDGSGSGGYGGTPTEGDPGYSGGYPGGSGTDNPDNGSTGGNTGNPPSDDNTSNPQEADPSLTDADGNPILTTPIISNGRKNHLEELNKITNQNGNGTNGLRNYIDQLVEDIDDPIEQGMEFKLNNNGSYSAYPAYSNGIDGTNFPPVSVNNPLIRIHKHHTGLNPVFSAEDVLGMVEFFIQKKNLNPDSSDNNNITSIMVSEDGVHALRISNPTELMEFNSYYSTPENKNAFTTAYKRKVITKSQNQCGGTCSDEEYKNFLFQNFLAFFKEMVWGIDFYYAPHPVNNNENYEWTKQN